LVPRAGVLDLPDAFDFGFELFAYFVQEVLKGAIVGRLRHGPAGGPYLAQAFQVCFNRMHKIPINVENKRPDVEPRKNITPTCRMLSPFRRVRITDRRNMSIFRNREIRRKIAASGGFSVKHVGVPPPIRGAPPAAPFETFASLIPRERGLDLNFYKPSHQN